MYLTLKGFFLSLVLILMATLMVVFIVVTILEFIKGVRKVTGERRVETTLTKYYGSVSNQVGKLTVEPISCSL